MLIQIENILSPTQVEQFRQQLETAPWLDGKLTAGQQAEKVKANQQLDDRSDIAISLGNIILTALSNNPEFYSASLPRKIYPPKFNAYSSGEHYGLHVDSSIMHLPNNQTMRTDLSATLFLSNPKEYEGGELVIETNYGAQEIKLNAGDIVLYPSTSLHQVMPVTQGTRVCAFFWLESLVRDSQKREMLFDLDQSIQVLTSERGTTDDEVKRLSGIYHNLIRTWVET